jgi:hypothetical protein
MTSKIIGFGDYLEIFASLGSCSVLSNVPKVPYYTSFSQVARHDILQPGYDIPNKHNADAYQI